MLVGLKQDRKLGDEIDVSIHFKNYQDLKGESL
jgi:copper(I)-binding protein